MDEDQRRIKREYMREWRARNAEKNRKYQKQYQQKYYSDPDKREMARGRAREWYYANRDRALAANRARNAAKPKRGRPSGERHHLWKGDEVSYGTLHRWVVRYRGKPSECEHCGTTTAKRFEWANRDHRYQRSLDDWIRLCTSCHRRYDYERGLAAKGGRRTA